MAKPKLALIPAAQGSKFYSVLPSDGVGDFDFARASAATRINKYGLIETVASGQSRLNYPLIDGVVKGCPSHILEPARTNSLPYSQDFSNAAWLKSNVTIISNSIISPDGTLNADELQVTSSGGNIYDNVGNTGDGVFSVFAKYKDTQFIRLRSTSSYAYFDIKNGIVGSTLSVLGTKIENYGNGWYKCSVIGNNTNSLAQIFVSSDGVNVGLGNVYLWGADFQMGSYPTSYIPTSGFTVTRVAETANNAGDASTFNDSEGVLMAEISALANDGTSKFVSINSGSNANEILYGFSATGNYLRLRANSSTVFETTISGLDALINSKSAIKYKSGDWSIYINGFKVGLGNETFSFTSNINELEFRGAAGSPFYGNTKQLQYFDSALNDSELETLTSWVSFQDMAISQQYSLY